MIVHRINRIICTIVFVGARFRIWWAINYVSRFQVWRGLGSYSSTYRYKKLQFELTRFLKSWKIFHDLTNCVVCLEAKLYSKCCNGCLRI